jgi:hypothetical protein
VAYTEEREGKAGSMAERYGWKGRFRDPGASGIREETETI